MRDARRVVVSRESYAASRRIAGAVLLVALASVGSARVVEAQRAEATFRRTLDVSEPVDLSVTTGSGSVTVRVGTVDRVEIEGRVTGQPSWWQSDARVAEEIQRLVDSPPIEQRGRTIVIGRLDDRDRVSITYEIVVPPRTSVTSRVGSGSQSIDGVTGAVEAVTGSGSVSVSNIVGDVNATSGSGGVSIDGVTGDVEVQVGSGSLTAHGIAGGLEANSGSGGLDIEGDPIRDWDLHAASGDVTVDVPDDAAFDLSARTQSGGIDSAHPVSVIGRIDRRQIEGRVRGGGARVEISSASGSIRIR